jgi:Membrane protein putatively involved in post-translational modification of the autoinducing quorum-sensing peptide
MNKILDKIGKGFLKYRITQEEDLEIYLFGMQSFIMHITHILSMLLLGLLMNRFIFSIIFIISYATLRTVAGGQHFKSAYICFVSSLFLEFAVLLPLNYFPCFQIKKLVVLFYLLGMCMTIPLSPCDNTNKPLNNIERKIYKRKTIYTLINLSICIAIFSKVNIEVGYIMAASIFIEGIGCVWGTLDNKCKVTKSVVN